MTLRLLIACGILTLLQCSNKKLHLVTELKHRQTEIDSLWAIEVSDSLKGTDPHYLNHFCFTQSGQILKLDTIRLHDWPESIASFHDILFTQDGRPVATQDIIAEYPKGIAMSRHYFNTNGESFARLIDNRYYEKGLEQEISESRLELYKADGTIIWADSSFYDESGDKLQSSVSLPTLDGRTFQSYKTFKEYIDLNRIDL